MTRTTKKRAPGVRVVCQLCDWWAEGSDLSDIVLASSKHDAVHAREGDNA